ncbi:MAG: hypothetical protein GXO70_08190, partial [Acidobacteria bacterium]|nr:hypothetical protein [Acidobacteriota bacterium]
MKRTVILVIFLSLIGASVLAQQQEKTEKEKAAAINIEGQFKYSPKSDRDPFVSPFDLERLKGKKNRRP